MKQSQTSSMNSSKSVLSKAKIQELVKSNDPSISFLKPKNKRSECWSNFSQVYHEDNPQDYIICLQCKVVLKWLSEHGTRVMTHHNCATSESSPKLRFRQRAISSYCRPSSSTQECSLFQKRITEACVEYCAVDGRSFGSVAGASFLNLAKQLMNAAATLGTSIPVHELLPHPTTVSIDFDVFSIAFILLNIIVLLLIGQSKC